MNGAYNAVAPNPVSYNQLINAIAKFSKRKSIPAPVMKWMIKIIVGEFGATLFQSMNCSSEKIIATVQQRLARGKAQEPRDLREPGRGDIIL